MNVITAQRTYATHENAVVALKKALAKAGMRLEEERYLIALSAADPSRFVPTLVGEKYIHMAHAGIMVVG